MEKKFTKVKNGSKIYSDSKLKDLKGMISFTSFFFYMYVYVCEKVFVERKFSRSFDNKGDKVCISSLVNLFLLVGW